MGNIIEQIWSLPWYQVLIIAAVDDVILFLKLWWILLIVIILFSIALYVKYNK